ncbi:MAG TPA: isochorismatase family protein [Prolixibacteraceae bacterium]|nr:isochorismatase family protein [Bacteroidales bacterium]HNZ71316.1 isochorismatase family protein [Prolixibacteraceae bacterium]HQN93292.1 isochorismatase family protein [Prolixibacteraceae bacterium]
MRIIKEDCIGLVIDIQERLYPAMARKEEFLGNSCKLVLGLQELSVPLIVTQQYSKGLGQTLVEVSSLISHFNPIEKVSFSCYDEPAFVEALEEADKKTVIICGIESHVCVLQTAVDLKAAGYTPVVIYDCTSSRNKDDWKIALERFRYENIMVLNHESLLFELTRTAASSSFKSISKLVK